MKEWASRIRSLFLDHVVYCACHFFGHHMCTGVPVFHCRAVKSEVTCMGCKPMQALDFLCLEWR